MIRVYNEAGNVIETHERRESRDFGDAHVCEIIECRIIECR